MRMERREHHRVRLRLPARIRWTTPFGQRTEVQETLDVSRGGLLLSSQAAAEPGAHVWVTFPYDSSIPDGQPEVPARVVRAESPVEGALRFGVRFDARPAQSRNGHNGLQVILERRASPRRPLAVPVRVRLESLPWFEEAMTFDVSLEGLRFLSTREYDLGARLMISFDSAATSPWPGGRDRFLSEWSSRGDRSLSERSSRGDRSLSERSSRGEFRTLVVRTEPEPVGTAIAVSVRRLPA